MTYNQRRRMKKEDPMTTCRELFVELSRMFTGCLSWIYGFALALLLLLRTAAGDRLPLVAALNAILFYLFIPAVILLVLVLITRSRRGLLAVALIIAAGGWLFAGYFIPKRPAPPTGDTVRVASFNLYKTQDDLTPALEWLKSTDTDVALLQGVSRSLLMTTLYRPADDFPHRSARYQDGGPLGVVILSRYPVVETSDWPSWLKGKPTRLGRFVLDVNGQKVAFYNVVFDQPSRSRSFLDYNDSLRNAEIDGLRDQLQNETYPFVVGGAFNVSDQSALYRQLSQQMSDAYREAGTGLGSTWPVGGVGGLTPGFMPPLLRYDYIWYSGAPLRPTEARLGPKLGSDHLPLVVTFDLGK
jgi:endonuclease/exonuclease/phosphatase (EEP) superfamily protein YafD